MKTLPYWLDVLKIKEDTELYRKALELEESVKGGNEWIRAMKIISNAYSSVPSYIFSQPQMYDFLTLSAKPIEEKSMNSVIIKNVILKMYRDIMENYDSLKSNYPGIIVDVISILHRGVDTKGSKVNPINIERYYQLRKQQVTITEESTKAAAVSATAIQKEKIEQSLVESLAQITNRDRKELEESIARLQDSDLKKISDLCQNHNKLQYYKC